MDAPDGDTDTTELDRPTEPTRIDATAAKLADPGGPLIRVPGAPAPPADATAGAAAGETTGDGRDDGGPRGQDGQDDQGGRRLEVNGIQVCAGTLASVSGAAVASVFGVAGTVAGAAVGSVIATVAGALYTHGLQQTGEKLQQHPVVRQWWQPRRSMAAPRSSTDDNSSASPDPDDRPAWREWLAERRWGVAVATAGVFVVSLLLITAVELIGQRPISGTDDRETTSIGSLFSGSEDPTDEAPGEDEAPGDPTGTTTADDGSSSDGGDTGGDEGTTDTTEAGGDDETTPTTGDDAEPPSTDPPAADTAGDGA